MPVSTSGFQNAAWYKATTLAERTALRCGNNAPLSPEKSEAASKLLRRWRCQAPFSSASTFSQRLGVLGISEDEFRTILGEPAASVQARCLDPPAWLNHLSEAFSDCLLHTALPLPDETDEPIFSLLKVARPLMTHGLSKLKESVAAVLREYSQPPLSMEAVQQVLLDSLSRQLLTILSRSMVLELNIARVQGSLEGESQEDRYRSFVQRLGQPETALAMMLEYPVLARQLVIRIDQWIGFIVEYVDRLCSDWGSILPIFAPDGADPGFLTHVSMDAGDRHRGGRCVLIATFSSGFKLVYKPKSMAVDVHFQELLNWINARGNHPSLRTLKIVDRGSYGWSEFVAAESCHSLPELRRFYERQGVYMALLYVLEATDFHSENIIAAGEQPVLIDLEAIFHPRLKVPELEKEADSAALSNSVLRVGLLPWYGYANEESDGIDLSGLGGAAGQITPYKVAHWEGVGTDEMKLSRRQMPIPLSRNRPSLNGLDAAPSDYVQEIVDGFVAVYRLLMEYRYHLVSPDGPLMRFAHDEVRVIFRPTKTYSVLLNESFHPDVLRDALDRDLLFDRLWITVESSPHLAKVISSECKDLQVGDIPFFSTCPNSLHVWSSTKDCFSNFFDESALSIAEHRLRRLCDGNLSLQCWLIRASLATTVAGHFQVEPDPSLTPDAQQGPIDRTRLLGAACTLGNKLESLAIRWSQNASWLGLTPANERQWTITTTMLDLYDGLPGIALFLAYLGSITGERRYSDLARETCNTMLRRSEEYKSVGMCIGGFAGWGGIIYALTHLGSLWNDPVLLSNAQDIVQLLPGLIASDENFDIIAGSAGCIGGLAALYRERQSLETLTAAKACGKRLIACAKQMPDGVGWIIAKQTAPLSGFAHGAAGIAWALLQVAKLTDEEIFRKTAQAAIAYERTLFNPETGNWRDLRTRGKGLPGKTGESVMSAWCHGAAGIGLARLSTGSYLDGNETRREIDTALNTTIREGFGRNHSLCHGDVGNIELLLQASRVLKDERWQLRAQRIANGIVDSVAHEECRCGTPLHVDSPGLMTGLAGIGYGLLRLAEPDRVPSVLTLQPPIGS
jgi:type 2 lantibiotic biosynthesis protein LanM